MCQINRSALIQFCRLLIFSIIINEICAHKCYVCKENCEFFNISTKFKYEVECPPKSTTCRAEIRDGSVILRSCEEENNYLLNDCQPLNGIKYCYCSKELCNDMLTDNLVEQTTSPSDDEDDEFEGSASKGNNVEEVISSLEPLTTQVITDLVKVSAATRIPKNALPILIIPIFIQYYQCIV